MGARSSSRRSFIKLAAAAPLLTQITARNLYAHAAMAIGRDPKQNVYTRLGVRTVINCRGTWTYLSGSLEFPEVRQAQVEAGQYFVNMLELQRGAGRRLAELTSAESGMVTSGAAGAMAQPGGRFAVKHRRFLVDEAERHKLGDGAGALLYLAQNIQMNRFIARAFDEAVHDG